MRGRRQHTVVLRFHLESVCKEGDEVFWQVSSRACEGGGPALTGSAESSGVDAGTCFRGARLVADASTETITC